LQAAPPPIASLGQDAPPIPVKLVVGGALGTLGVVGILAFTTLLATDRKRELPRPPSRIYHSLVEAHEAAQIAAANMPTQSAHDDKLALWGGLTISIVMFVAGCCLCASALRPRRG
jgi:hypothetical protein